MFRITRYLKMASASAAPSPGHGHGKGGERKPPAVIWNLTRTCNLECVHCYSSSTQRDFSRELTFDQVAHVIGDLKEAGVQGVILSGGEPMIREDIMDIARACKEAGLILALSTNGTLIGETQADEIIAAGFDYIGISLDGMKKSHDLVRGKEGAFDEAVAGLMRLKERGKKAGIRFTLTRLNIDDLPEMFSFVEENEIEKIYLSHLVYSGRGSANRAEDLTPEETRRAMEFVYQKAREYVTNGSKTQIVTGNNDADAVFMLLKLREEDPEMAQKILPALLRFGGNSAGHGVANIDPTGEVHPDPLMSSVNLGNVIKEPFGKIWFENHHPVLARLREKPRQLKGRCGECTWIGVCGGNTRVRAERLTGDLWGSDPACYLTDEEITREVVHAV